MSSIRDEDAGSLSPSNSSTSQIGGEESTQYEVHGFEENSDIGDSESNISLTSDDEERPNRWIGPASTWRSYTENERTIADTLGQDQANDLSIHLYNAHAFKVQLRGGSDSQRLKPWTSKSRWISSDETGNQPWHPDQSWTSWPLPTDEVPRSSETFARQVEATHESAPYRREEDWFPSKFLEEELQALMLRAAKERFRARKWETPEAESTPRDTQPPGNADLENGSGSRNPSRNSSRSEIIDCDNQPEDVDNDDDDDTPNMASSCNQDMPYTVPSLLTDDDEAKIILLPNIRHIISKFDELLMGLHKSRMGHVRTDVHARAGSRSKSRSQSRSRQRSPSSSFRGGSPRSRDTSIDSAPSDEVESPAPRKRQRWRSESGVLSRRLNTRDWSEVLGVASLMGWEPGVVDRASRRCAALFGESVTFRQMPETVSSAPKDEILEYKPEMMSSSTSSSEAGSLSVDEQTELVCPYLACTRHVDGFEKAWRFREHMRRVHQYNKKQLEELEGAIGSGSGTGKVINWEPPDPLQCPIGGCNKPDKIYSEARRLIEHMRRAHGIDPRRGDSTSVISADGTSGSQSGLSDGERLRAGEAYGAVHVDGFLQPLMVNIPRGKDVVPRLARSRSEQRSTRGQSAWERKLERREAKAKRRKLNIESDGSQDDMG